LNRIYQYGVKQANDLRMINNRTDFNYSEKVTTKDSFSFEINIWFCFSGWKISNAFKPWNWSSVVRWRFVWFVGYLVNKFNR